MCYLFFTTVYQKLKYQNEQDFSFMFFAPVLNSHQCRLKQNKTEIITFEMIHKDLLLKRVLLETGVLRKRFINVMEIPRQ